MNEEHFYEPVVGITFDERQNVVSKLFEGEALTLRREPCHPYLDNAIMVLRENGDQVGYIRRDLADTLIPRMAALEMDTVDASVVSLTGGAYPGAYRGVRILFSLPEPEYAEV